jgi:hypothetical protein
LKKIVEQMRGEERWIEEKSGKTNAAGELRT